MCFCILNYSKSLMLILVDLQIKSMMMSSKKIMKGFMPFRFYSWSDLFLDKSSYLSWGGDFKLAVLVGFQTKLVFIRGKSWLSMPLFHLHTFMSLSTQQRIAWSFAYIQLLGVALPHWKENYACVMVCPPHKCKWYYLMCKEFACYKLVPLGKFLCETPYDPTSILLYY